ncbi:hypothetical protein E1218_21585 [Kribbella turkmenica]|uniref:Uncharacterized protein n=1 Tax=Kribbella turkmenica TaxID=2530375 RepID=A0A4R4WTS0_9ACTN|nr:hypothetical protein [Kribbella turkmenica]TDD21014.1 hypothetical protein E1218_21585 [Kribbella turkmenica]
MRISKRRLTPGFTAAREGDLDQAVDLALNALRAGRQSRVHLRMITNELNQGLRSRYPSEPLLHDFVEALRAN